MMNVPHMNIESVSPRKTFATRPTLKLSYNWEGKDWISIWTSPTSPDRVSTRYIRSVSFSELLLIQEDVRLIN